MTDDPARTEPPPRRRVLDRALLTTALALVAAAGFAVGRATAPADASGNAACEDAQAAFRAALDDADSAPADDIEVRFYTAVAANTAVQNPDCFTAEDRAAAQTYLDAVERTSP
ncbi:hypothetical protein RM780_07740 [Streptomyces sp. DSM 44917]|uniref:Uncharacterized protein n=1 Tax=Streptomyces boetiae TaxID=3075541 RepID=A0ABU2L5M3_9ACTN|nr:hypothetical protein [Streptomyces sp. DSM 44917]MDT0306854.1 hypothetical protein [Streptomyces sp. DSM 44917]